jgi:2'-5' RNA ligase
MRLFTGIALAPHVVEKLSKALNDLRPKARINWAPAENLHITSKFIGDWADDRLATLTTALDTVSVTGPISITISRFGFFPNPHHPHSFFAGVLAGPGLAELAAAIDDALLPLGLAAETRPYRPHVTLARIKASNDIRGLREHIAGIADLDFGSFEAPEFHLYLSQQANQGPTHATTGRSIYTKLATYDLMRENKANS